MYVRVFFGRLERKILTRSKLDVLESLQRGESLEDELLRMFIAIEEKIVLG